MHPGTTQRDCRGHSRVGQNLPTQHCIHQQSARAAPEARRQPSSRSTHGNTCTAATFRSFRALVLYFLFCHSLPAGRLWPLHCSGQSRAGLCLGEQPQQPFLRGHCWEQTLKQPAWPGDTQHVGLASKLVSPQVGGRPRMFLYKACLKHKHS